MHLVIFPLCFIVNNTYPVTTLKNLISCCRFPFVLFLLKSNPHSRIAALLPPLSRIISTMFLYYLFQMYVKCIISTLFSYYAFYKRVELFYIDIFK
jgi:hypothetical protein